MPLPSLSLMPSPPRAGTFISGVPPPGNPVLKHTRSIATLYEFELDRLFSFWGKVPPKPSLCFCQFPEASAPAACEWALPLQQSLRPSILFFFFCYPTVHGVPGPGIRPELQLQPIPQLRQCRSLTHRARPGIEPASWYCKDAADCILPQQELPSLSL